MRYIFIIALALLAPCIPAAPMEFPLVTISIANNPVRLNAEATVKADRNAHTIPDLFRQSAIDINSVILGLSA